MLKITKIITVLLAALLLWSGCDSANPARPELTIVGDLQESVKLNDIWKELTQEQISYNEQRLQGVNTELLLQSLALVYEQNDIYFKAADGFMIKLAEDTLGESYLGYSETDQWVFISDKHPVNSRIKNIDEMIIVKNSDKTHYDFGLNIIVGDSTINFSLGELRSSPYQVAAFSEGVTTKSHGEKDYEVDVMQLKKTVELSSLVSEDIDSLLVMDQEGEYDYIYGETGLVEIDDSGINLILSDRIYRDIVGMIVNPPAHNVMDTYYDTLHYLQQGQNVLVILIDGFSYQQYQYFSKNHPDLFLAGIKRVARANTVFKPVTNAGFAAMITGQPPQVNGVLNRSYRELKVDTIFDKAVDLGQKSILIEGDTSILKTSITPSLNIDTNKNGFKDDEIFLNAMGEINNGYDLFFVHFHSLDEVGHNYGAINDSIVQQMKVLDSYVADLVNSWAGKVVIVSDHGMHNTATGGSHGEFRAEDMLIPYMILDGGKN